jgi:hypothetical protein
MSTTQVYVKRAEECERLAGACTAEPNREILLYAAARWRVMAEDAAAGAFPAPPAKRCRETMTYRSPRSCSSIRSRIRSRMMISAALM